MRLRHCVLAVAIVSAAPLCAGAAQAQSVRLIGDFRSWSAYAATEGANTVCFALARPAEVTPTPEDYGQAFLYLTNRPAENVANELNLVAGFTFAPDAPATVSVGETSFALFTEGDAAWLQNPAQGETLAGAIRAGSSLVVKGTSDKGVAVTQTFSLSGATAATEAAASGC